MSRVFSNGPSKDFVFNPFTNMVHKSSKLLIAAPFVTMTQELLEATRKGKSVCLLVGLNSTTTPEALSAVHGVPNFAIRYFTGRRFHAKIYLFDSGALVGSSNLTDGGLRSNREATIRLDEPDDLDSIEELRTLFWELWNSALVLTTEKLNGFTAAYKRFSSPGPNPDSLIEGAIGKAEPFNINVESNQKGPERIFLERLYRQVYEQYRPSFNEVTKILEENHLQRAELKDAGTANETNRFLNWVRLTYAPGDEWELAPDRSPGERRAEILRLGHEWTQTDQNKIPENYLDGLRLLRMVFGSEDAIEVASKEQLTGGLLSIYAFNEQLRFVKGGKANLRDVFWSANNEDLGKAKRTLKYLVHGGGEFIQRLHDVLYDPTRKLAYFGMFCALELYGTVKPEDCPPMNGRMAKSLRYLGFNVRGA